MSDHQVISLSGTVRRVEHRREMPSGVPAISFAVKSVSQVGSRSYNTWYRCTGIGNMARLIEDARLGAGDYVSVVGVLMPGPDGNPKIWEKNGRHYSNYEVRVDSLVKTSQPGVSIPDDEP